MPTVVLDSGAVTWLASNSPRATAFIRDLRRLRLWPPVVPTAVLVECLSGRQRGDVAANRLLKSCVLIEDLPVALARRAAFLRGSAGRGSAVDAVVVAVAEPDGVVLTGDVDDISALAASTSVSVRGI